MDLNYIGGLRSKVEAEKIRKLLIKRYRPWISGGLDLVGRSLTVERTPEMNRTKTDRYPWRIVHTPQVRQIETMSGTKTEGVWNMSELGDARSSWQIENFSEWNMSELGEASSIWQIENFSERALDFYQGYLLGCQESRANKGRKKNARIR